jgi:hypothetical protein
MAQSIQHDPAALILELSAASTPNLHSPIASPGSQLHDAMVSIPLVQNIHQVTPAAQNPASLVAYPLSGSKPHGQNWPIFPMSPSVRNPRSFERLSHCFLFCLFCFDSPSRIDRFGARRTKTLLVKIGLFSRCHYTPFRCVQNLTPSH